MQLMTDIREPIEDEVFNLAVTDEALEKLASDQAITGTPTAPAAIICVPFERP
jgi:hypothetical protein